MKSGENLLNSDDFPEDSRLRPIYVRRAIKGKFDRLAIYKSRIMLGQDRKGFAPNPRTKWIVFFKEEPEGNTIGWKDSEKTMPVLKLASKKYGLIRYDAPNDLKIDAKAFLSDLETLLEHVKTPTKLTEKNLKTELGKTTLLRLKAQSNKGNKEFPSSASFRDTTK